MRKRPNEMKTNIIECAKALFLDNGYTSTTLDSVAKDAGITKRTLYGYFDSKGTLLKEVIEELVGVPWVFAFSVDNIQHEEDLYYILYNIAKGINEVFSNIEYVKLIRICITEVNAHPEINEMLDSGINRQSLALVTHVLSIANENGIVPITNPEFRAQSFVGGLLLEFYSTGLLAPTQVKLNKYTHSQLMAYVADCMPIVVKNLQEYTA